MQVHSPEAVFLGLKFAEWVNLAGLILGPIVAVLITLWIDGRRRSYERKIVVLRLLLATRHIPADPNFANAINLVPVEFAGSSAVQNSYREFVQAASVIITPETSQSVGENTRTKITRLVYEISRNLGLNIRETDIQTQGYSSTGWTQRDTLLQDSQRAMRDIANILTIQARQIAGVTLTEDEKRQLGLQSSEQK